MILNNSLIEVLKEIVLPLAIVGVLYYFVMKLPVPSPFRELINVVVIIAVIIWLFGFL